MRPPILMLSSALVLLSWATGCEPNTKSPIAIWTLALDSTRNLVPTKTELTTLSNAVEGSGTAAIVLGNADIDLDPSSSNPIPNDGTALHNDFLMKDKALFPADAWSWAGITHYAMLEQSFLYFVNEIGIPSTDLGQVASYLAPNYTDVSQGGNPLTDGATYNPLLDALVFLPQTNGLTPTYMNQGVVGIEYGHWIFAHEALGLGTPQSHADLVTGSSPGWASSIGLHVVLGLDEGLADFHAFMMTCGTAYGCDFNFLNLSEPAEDAQSRDFSSPVWGCLPASELAFVNQPGTISDADYVAAGHANRLGTAIAAALYSAATDIVPSGGGDLKGYLQQVAQATVAAYYDASATSPGFYQVIDANQNAPSTATLAAFIDALANHFSTNSSQPVALQVAVCKELKLHLGLVDSDLPSCPTSDLSKGCGT